MLDILSLSPSPPARPQPELLWQSACVCPLRLSDSFTFPCFLIYVLSSFLFKFQSSGSWDFLCCAMVMQSRGHWEKAPEDQEECLCVSGQGERLASWPWPHSLAPAFPVPCLLPSKGRGETGAGKAPS